MLKSLPECGPTARSIDEKVKLGVIIELMMPESWFDPWIPERKASDWNRLRVLSLKVEIVYRDSA